MKRLLFIGLLSAFVIVAACQKNETKQTSDQKAASAQKAQKQGAPDIEFIGGNEFDFGTITQGEQVKHSFKFKNTGTGVLELGRPRTTCGCTASLVSKNKIAPGEIGEVQVTFNSTGKQGKQNRRVTIDTNIPGKKQLVFTLKGEVKVDISIKPRYISLGKLTVKKVTEKKLTIRNNGEKPFTITGVEVNGPSTSKDTKGNGNKEVVVSLKNGTVVEPGKEVEFTVAFRPTKPTARFSGRIVLSTSHPKQKMIFIGFFGRVADKNGNVPTPPARKTLFNTGKNKPIKMNVPPVKKNLKMGKVKMKPVPADPNKVKMKTPEKKGK